ncbi:hypothetical protein IJU97_04915 [bacterium]|nr:hypothetical protein [bacterium]
MYPSGRVKTFDVETTLRSDVQAEPVFSSTKTFVLELALIVTFQSVIS